MKTFFSVNDAGDIQTLVDTALMYKQHPLLHKAGGKDKRLGLLFLNPSLRTRISTQIAAANLGMDAIVFNVDKDGWRLEFEDDVVMNGTTVEHIKDAAPVLGQYFDILAVRSFPGLLSKEDDYSEQIIHQFAKHSGIPVLSLESATRHPLQSLADIVTMEEVLRAGTVKHRPKVVLTWAPHVKPLPQCVANSFAEWVIAWQQADFVIAHPEGMELDPKFTKGATIEYNQDKAIANADFIYVKNWSSVEPYGKLLEAKHDWMLTPERLSVTRNAGIMHCLPVRRNVELSGALLDSANSLVTRQAGNRVWSAQSVLAKMLGL